MNSILLLATFYLFYTTARDFFINRFKNISQSISHFGFSLLVLSILLNSIFSTEVTANLKVGDKYNFNNGSIIFSSLKRSNGSNYESLIGNFIIINC